MGKAGELFCSRGTAREKRASNNRRAGEERDANDIMAALMYVAHNL